MSEAPNNIEIMEIWEITKGYLLALDQAVRPEEGWVNAVSSSVHERARLMDYYFSPFMIGLFSTEQKGEIIKYLLEIRAHFLGKPNYYFPIEKCKEIYKKVDEMQEYLDKIGGNIPNLEVVRRLYDVIEEELKDVRNKGKEVLGELTTHSISKPFREQYEKHLKSRIYYTRIFYFFLLVLIAWISTNELFKISLSIDLKGWELMALKVFSTMPFVWATQFTAKKANEMQKIEQTYLHKFTIAQSYLNYLAFIKEDGRFIRDRDEKNQALQTLHKVAMDGLGLNPALLLEKGSAEKIPMEELLIKLIDVKNSQNKG